MTKFYDSTTIKLKDWDYEKEYRLILNGMNCNYGVEQRKLKYEFNDLEGIVFGINTSEQHKLEIIKIVEAKCRTNNRNDFKFYQAYYSSRNGKIELKEMDFIKFNS